MTMSLRSICHRSRVESAIKRTTKRTGATLEAIQETCTELEKLARCGDFPAALALTKELTVAMDEASAAFAGIAKRLRESVEKGARDADQR